MCVEKRPLPYYEDYIVINTVEWHSLLQVTVYLKSKDSMICGQTLVATSRKAHTRQEFDASNVRKDNV